MRRAIAIEFVAQLLERGYTVERAEQESMLGYDSCDGSERSYIIQKGVIQVPYRPNGERFRFRTLAAEIRKAPPPVKPIGTKQLTLI